MKYKFLLYTFLLFLLISSCAKQINAFGETDWICQKYDSVNDITFVYDQSTGNSIKVKGKWREHKLKVGDKYYISHCPIIENQDKTVLELWMRPEKNEVLNNVNNSDLKRIYNTYLEFWKKRGLKITLLKTNLDASYYVFQIVDNNTVRMELMGIKNKKYYRISIFDYEKNTETDVVSSLIELFNLN